MIEVSKRLDNINEYYFSKKLQEIAMLNADGKNIINLGIGSPDLAPDSSIIETLHTYASKLHTHSYQSYKGVPIFREAIANWYQKFYNVNLNPNSEILPLIGSKEGIMHLCMTYLNEGDAVLIPNPGYPTYASAVQLAGGTIINYDLTQKNNWQPDFEELEKQNLHTVKMIFVNYPHMPTGAKATMALFEKIIDFGKKHNILIVNDNPYSFILNEQPLSILQINGAIDVAVELNSLSKSLNMAGWRIGMLCGNENIVNNVLRFKSNMDSGMFLPVQMAAAKALELDRNWYNDLNSIYEKRKNIVLQIVAHLNCSYDVTQQGLFIWAKIDTTKYKDGYSLSDEILYNKNVFITPGGIFGTNGNDYIRVSLCQSEEILKEAFLRIKKPV
jgi:LL-diaminopimelate aminotransferase